MKYFSLLVGAFVLGMPVAARAQSEPAQPAAGVTLADLVGTWSGAPVDSTGAPVAGRSMTLTMGADSTFTWTGVTSTSCLAKPNSRWARLTSTNVSWCGGPGYNIKLEGNKLTLTSVDKFNGKNQTLVLTKTDAAKTDSKPNP